jgi:hypothetical protein
MGDRMNIHTFVGETLWKTSAWRTKKEIDVKKNKQDWGGWN